MNHEDLIQKILAIPAETQTVEFKRLSGSKGDVSKVVEAVVAMANAEGGVIVLGVDDPEKTEKKGFERIFGIEENIENYDAIPSGRK